MSKKRYSEDEKLHALAVLAANSGNLSKTARETGIPRLTIREWRGSQLSTHPEIDTLKTEIQSERKALMKEVLHSGLQRALELLPTEKDLFKVTGLIKTMSELRITEEVAEEYARPASGVPAADGPAPYPGGATSPRIN